MILFSEETIREYISRGWWGTKTLLDYLEDNLKNFPDKTAFVTSYGSATWKETNLYTKQLAVNFSRLGITRDEFVLLQMPNSLEFILVHLALARLGAITVPAVLPFRSHEIRKICEKCHPKWAVIFAEHGEYDFMRMYRGLHTEGRLKNIVFSGNAEPLKNEFPLSDLLEITMSEKEMEAGLGKFPVSANDIVSMCFTSGTEAEPKGVPRSHNNWISMASIIAIDAWGRDSENDVIVTPLPLPNLFGLGCALYPTLIMGQTMVVLDGFDPAECVEAVEKYRATQIMGVPMMHMAILHSQAVEKSDISSLVRVVTGGGPASPALINGWKERFGVGVVNGWGANEGTFCGTRWDQRERIADTIGPHPPSYDMFIAGERGEPLPPGKVGEIVMRGPCIFPGYWDGEKASRDCFDAHGYFYSGDMGMLGFDGLYRFQGRKKDLIVRGGQNISPEEVEFLTEEHPKVLQAAAIGVRGRSEEQIWVFVRLVDSSADMEISELVDFFRKKDVARFKYPRRLVVVDDIPRTPTGKVQKYKLREEAEYLKQARPH